MQTYLKTKPAGIQLLLFMGMAFGIFLILSLIGGAALSKMTGISMLQLQDVSNWNAKDPNMIFFIRGMLLIQFLGLFVIPSLLFSYLSDPRPLDYIGLKNPSQGIFWVYGILCLLVSIPFVDYMGYLNQKIFFGTAQNWVKGMEDDAAKQIQFMLSKHTPTELVLNLIFIAGFAGIGEELFFRGVLQRLFIKSTRSPIWGIIITAALFSGFHFQFFGFIPRFLLGAILGAIYWYSGSLWTAIIAHFVYDGLMIVLVYFNPDLIKHPDSTLLQQSQLQLLITAAISLLLTWLLLQQMRKKSSTDYHAVYAADSETAEELTDERWR